ncbi:hypothetical protein IDH44_07765 [Paenibacillus sp. IB182496]|uniref:Uncharacterized protein n=1 Tax=Paenibacillus sabuli TaxID=2772509 RepID=A0A927GR03_9BACL|nr:hypothetical protein [Paenibacillus sabuli]MBD2845084.1 hypothetical protein [Paenibacillus sabuli]
MEAKGAKVAGGKGGGGCNGQGQPGSKSSKEPTAKNQPRAGKNQQQQWQQKAKIKPVQTACTGLIFVENGLERHRMHQMPPGASDEA